MSQSDSYSRRPLTQACEDNDNFNDEQDEGGDDSVEDVCDRNVGSNDETFGSLEKQDPPAQSSSEPNVNINSSQISEEIVVRACPHSSLNNDGALSSWMAHLWERGESTLESSVGIETPEERDMVQAAEREVQEHGARIVLEGLSRAMTPGDEGSRPYLSKCAIEALEHKIPILSPCLSPTFSLQCSRKDKHNILKLSSCFAHVRSLPLSTGCRALDELLGGGLPMDTHGLFEVSGPASAGKTQLMVQLCVMCAMPADKGGKGAMSIYASTEGRPPVLRVKEMCSTVPRRLFGNVKEDNDNEYIEKLNLASKIIVERVRTSEHLLDWARTRLPYLLRVSGAKLVIIDSIAALYRAELPDPVARAKHGVHLARALRNALVVKEAVCVCVNQVSQALDKVTGSLDAVVPALGTGWGQLVDTRLFIRRTVGNKRVARVLHSSYLPSSGGTVGTMGGRRTEGESARFQITGSGVEDDD